MVITISHDDGVIIPNTYTSGPSEGPMTVTSRTKFQGGLPFLHISPPGKAESSGRVAVPSPSIIPSGKDTNISILELFIDLKALTIY